MTTPTIEQRLALLQIAAMSLIDEYIVGDIRTKNGMTAEEDLAYIVDDLIPAIYVRLQSEDDQADDFERQHRRTASDLGIKTGEAA